MMTERQSYEKLKAEMLATVERWREHGKVGTDAAEYFLRHLTCDDEKMTFCYTGDPKKLQLWRFGES